jgi:hypothetical protein
MISALDEAPYKRLRKTPAYEKLAHGREHEVVETDFLYFYGVTWHTKRSVAPQPNQKCRRSRHGVRIF